MKERSSSAPDHLGRREEGNGIAGWVFGGHYGLVLN